MSGFGNLWLPPSAGTFGPPIDHLILMITWIVGVWFLLAEGALFYFIFAYRKREGVKAVHLDGTGRQKWWIFAPVVLIIGFDVAIDLKSAPLWDLIKINIPAGDVQVRVLAQQFAWSFIYAGKDGVFDTDDDVRSPGTMRVPVNKKIHWDLRAVDVLHSFSIPAMRFKQDGVPGRSIPGWFEANVAGEYPIVCSQICGVGHSTMGGKLLVTTDEEFSKYLKDNEPEPDEGSSPAGEKK